MKKSARDRKVAITPPMIRCWRGTVRAPGYARA
jgi:hypothetical protein